MIIGKNRLAVVENIKNAVQNDEFYKKVEIGDPILTSKQSRDITTEYINSRKKPFFKLKSFLARRIANIGSEILNRDTEIIGAEKLPKSLGGTIITSNHFGQLENTIIRYMVKKKGGKRLNVVSQVSNFAMKGAVGYLMNYADTIPLSTDFRYLTGDFTNVLKELMEKNETVLIYPEQEMWFNYRKPRPVKRGAYHFAAKLSAPIISCFVEIIDTNKKEDENFYRNKYRLHILGVLYPDDNKSVKQNSEELALEDYRLKCEAYEKCYNKPLSYDFEASDIGGFIP